MTTGLRIKRIHAHNACDHWSRLLVSGNGQRCSSFFLVQEEEEYQRKRPEHNPDNTQNQDVQPYILAGINIKKPAVESARTHCSTPCHRRSAPSTSSILAENLLSLDTYGPVHVGNFSAQLQPRVLVDHNGLKAVLKPAARHSVPSIPCHDQVQQHVQRQGAVSFARTRTSTVPTAKMQEAAQFEQRTLKTA